MITPIVDLLWKLGVVQFLLTVTVMFNSASIYWMNWLLHKVFGLFDHL